MTTAATNGAAATVAARHELWETAGELKEHWYVACTAAELRRDRIRAATILGLGIVVFRLPDDDSPAAIVDQCVHRGTALSAGRIVDGCLACPYHGWRYDRTGRVVHIPSIDGAAAPEKPHAFRQRSFAAREAYGLIWVYPGEADPATRDIFTMPYWRADRWVNYYMVSRFDGSVGALAQNFMDVPHTVHVHNRIFRSSPAKLMRSTVSVNPASVEVEYHEADDSIGMMPWLTNPQRVPLVHWDRFFAPNITRCDYHWGDRSGFVITSQITPIDGRSSRVYTLISYRFPVPYLLTKLLRPFIHLYTRAVLGQDIRIMRINRRGLDNAPGPTQRSVRADAVHVGIDRVIEATRKGEALDQRHLGQRPMDFNL